MTNGILSSTLSAIYSNGFSRLDVYEKLIGKAFSSTNIPFEEPWYGQLYSEKAKDLKWLASSLIINAEKEAEGARQLWKMANKVNNNRWSNLIRQHAIDEARHAKIYLRLFELIFPGSADNDLQNYFATLAPKYSMNEMMIWLAFQTQMLTSMAIKIVKKIAKLNKQKTNGPPASGVQ